MNKYVGIGSDPEVFVADPTGKVVPVIGLVGGSKDEPLSLGDGYAVQEDGVALEYNIPVCYTAESFVSAIHVGLQRASSKLPPGHTTIINPDHTFNPDQLTDPMAWVSGCDPDFSAWTGEKRMGSDYLKSAAPFARYCGGHVHLSYPDAANLSPMTKVHLVRILDMLLGVPSKWLEGNSVRSQLFGDFGMYRPKPYGLEYRTMSNVWLKDQMLLNWVAIVSLFVANLAPNAKRVHDYVYNRDNITVARELAELKRLNKETVTAWARHVRAIGMPVPADIVSYLLGRNSPTSAKSSPKLDMKVDFGQFEAIMLNDARAEGMEKQRIFGQLKPRELAGFGAVVQGNLDNEDNQ